MPVFQANNIGYQFSNGDVLFKGVSCSMNRRRVALTGRNGAGKTTLAGILCGSVLPTRGSVVKPRSWAMYCQQFSELRLGTLTIAEYLGKHAVLDALDKVEQGDCEAKWFELIGDEWDARQRLESQLLALSLPTEPDLPCASLSGGQLARLQLWKLFDDAPQLLVLDEPSNHLDGVGRAWLADKIASFEGAILLISHDRALLRLMEETWELSALGLQVYGGNYDVYAHQKQAKLDATELQIVSLQKQQKRIEAQSQKSEEKAQQRAAQGKKLRREGSQPKLVMNSKKERASARASSRNKNAQLRQAHLRQQYTALLAKREVVQEQRMHLTGETGPQHQVICLQEGRLPYGCAEPINLQLRGTDKVHLCGHNGSGKSTLLKVLQGQCKLLEGELRLNTSVYGLDQHFSSVRPQWSAMQNLMEQCAGMMQTTARTLLAGIGFRGDSVFRSGQHLSGGEKMKLAMLIVTHQPDSPFLLLDEPDNHLDLCSRQHLAQALSHYRGGFFLVSHDPEFVEEAGVTGSLTLQ